MGQKYAVFDEKGLPMGFYDSEINTNIPEEAIPITLEVWKELLDKDGEAVFIDNTVVNVSDKVWENGQWRTLSYTEQLQRAKQQTMEFLDQYARGLFIPTDYIFIKITETQMAGEDTQPLIEKYSQQIAERRQIREWLEQIKTSISNATTLEELENIRNEIQNEINNKMGS